MESGATSRLPMQYKPGKRQNLNYVYGNNMNNPWSTIMSEKKKQLPELTIGTNDSNFNVLP
jgi:hypothetical protein